MKRIKITLPEGGRRIGELGSNVGLNRGVSFELQAEEIIIEGDVAFFGNLNAAAPALLPFDLEAAKDGAPLVTRDGRKARFLAHVPEARSDCRVVAYIEGETGTREFPESGVARLHTGPNGDLFMAPKRKRTVWVNFYSNRIAHYHDSEAFAKKGAGADCIATVPVEIDA